ncbi:MAG TPA: choice-of-anchor D domain-containing protein [Solimonas sp.]
MKAIGDGGGAWGGLRTLALAAGLAWGLPASAVTLTATPNLAIPDNNGPGVCSTIAVAGAGNVTQAQVEVSIDHPWVGDLNVRLNSPLGTQVVLVNRPGNPATSFGSSANWNGFITFRDGAAVTSESMGAGLTDAQTICATDGICEYAPSNNATVTSLATFNGESADGNWQLCVSDLDAISTGTFQAWALTLNDNGLATPTLTATASAASVTVGSDIHDTAVLSGGNAPAGTLEFYLYGPGDESCTGAALSARSVSVTGAGTYVSPDFTTSLLGTHRYRAFYLGDANNNAVSTACNAVGQNVEVTAAGAPQLRAAPAAIDFGTQAVGGSASMIVTVDNPGTADLSIGTVTRSGDDYTIGANTCSSATVAPATGSCTIEIVFAPSTTGTRSGSLNIPSNAADSPRTVSLTGVGAEPGFSASPSPVAFGSQALGGSSAPLTVTISNTGGASLVLGTVTISGSADFSVSNDSCSGQSLAASVGTCTFRVTFTPSVLGARSGSLHVTSNASGSPHTIALSGTGVQAGITISPSPAAFGSQTVGTSSAPQTVTIRNSGSANLILGTVMRTGADFSLSNDLCSSAVLAPDASCTLQVRFSPTAAGARSGSLTVSSNAPGTPHSVALSGTGVAAPPTPATPRLSASPSPADFGTQEVGHTSSPLTVTVRNSGSGTLEIGSVGLVGAEEFAIVDDTCANARLVAGARCVVSVTLTPSATGTRTATLRLLSNAAGSPHEITLSGSGVQPALSASPSPLAFGDQAVGSRSAAVTVTVTNTGSAVLVVDSIGVAGANVGDFALAANTCGSSLGVGASCVVEVVFAPTAAGLRTASVTLHSNAAGSPHTVTVSGTGVSGGGTTGGTTGGSTGGETGGETGGDGGGSGGGALGWSLLALLLIPAAWRRRRH